MPYTLSRTRSDISERGKALLPLKSLEQHNAATLEDFIEPPLPVIWPNIQNRCSLLTFLTLEADGNWKVLSLPVQCSENTTRRSQYPGRSSTGSRVRSQPRSRAICASDLLDGDSKAHSPVRTCTSKKSRKKRKQGKKSTSNGVSARISPLPSRQSNLQENLIGVRDIPENTAASSDQKVPEKCPVSSPIRNEPRDNPSLNGSINSDGHESLKIHSKTSDIEGGEIRCQELPNSGTSGRLLNDVVDLSDQRAQTRRSNSKSYAKKSSRIKTVVNSSSVPRSCNLGNSFSFNTGKENSHPIWQKVKRKVQNEWDSTRVNGKHETNEAPKDEEKKQLLAKESGKAKRKQSFSFKHESNHYSGSSNKSKPRSSNKSSHSNIISISKVASPNDICSVDLRSYEAECFKPEPVAGEGLRLCGGNSYCTAKSDSRCMEDTDSLSGEIRLDLNMMSPPACSPLLANGVSQSGKEDVLSWSCVQKTTSGCITQKWVPVGTKTLASTGLRSKSCDSVEYCQAETCQEENLSVNSESAISISVSGVENSSTPSDEEERTDSSASHKSIICQDQDDGVASNSSMISGLKGECQTDLNRIARAVDNAHRAQLASEAFHMATGAPIAEFERFLHLSSPVLCLPCSITSKMCLRNHLDPSLFLLETPGIPLGYLWQWYQKHGSFGLEIRGKDYNNSKRLGIDRFSFRAYFVPYLSAVQLFKAGKKQMANSLSGYPDNSELIFEYFELEQPQQRQPFHEKIQELVRGDGPCRNKAYGDPTNLISLNIQDLDPRSWYSVAWYPIYRIPDGNFRAAFLTYHSLGHFVRNGSDNCLVSPVVGLQSYNAQSECWFKLSPSVISHESQSSGINPVKILRERLGTLEEVASLMSRASVSKGDGLPTLNNHPDFEFFLSRRRYY